MLISHLVTDIFVNQMILNKMVSINLNYIMLLNLNKVFYIYNYIIKIRLSKLISILKEILFKNILKLVLQLPSINYKVLLLVKNIRFMKQIIWTPMNFIHLFLDVELSIMSMLINIDLDNINFSLNLIIN